MVGSLVPSGLVAGSLVTDADAIVVAACSCGTAAAVATVIVVTAVTATAAATDAAATTDATAANAAAAAVTAVTAATAATAAITATATAGNRAGGPRCLCLSRYCVSSRKDLMGHRLLFICDDGLCFRDVLFLSSKVDHF